MTTKNKRTAAKKYLKNLNITLPISEDTLILLLEGYANRRLFEVSHEIVYLPEYDDKQKQAVNIILSFINDN